MNLLVRADATPEIGAGHVMRCLALVQAWRKAGGGAALAHVEPLPYGLARRLGEEGVALHPVAGPRGSEADADSTRELAIRSAAAIVLDGYAFDTSYQARAGRGARAVLVVDDGARCGPHRVDLVLDSNPADAGLYADLPAGTTALLGTRYVLLRRELQRGAVAESPPRDDTADGDGDPVRAVLLLLGGSDPLDLAPAILAALAEALPVETQVSHVVGAAGTGPVVADEPPAFLAPTTAAGPRVETVVDPPDLGARMATADLAVSAAGATAWELAHHGVPTVLLSVAANQRSIAASLAAHGCALDVTPGTIAADLPRSELTTAVAAGVRVLAGDPARRRTMRDAGRAWVDGGGAARVARHLWLRAEKAA